MHACMLSSRARDAHAIPTERPRPMHPFRSAIEAGETERALELFSPDVVFNSPVVYRPYQGREALGVILSAVTRVFEDFRYEREIGAEGASDHALVFGAAWATASCRVRLPSHRRGRPDRRVHGDGPAAIGGDRARGGDEGRGPRRPGRVRLPNSEHEGSLLADRGSRPRLQAGGRLGAAGAGWRRGLREAARGDGLARSG